MTPTDHNKASATTRDKRVVCPICHSYVNRKGDLPRHTLAIHGSKEVKEALSFKCSFCDKTSLQKCNILRHEKTHNSIRDIVCEYDVPDKEDSNKMVPCDFRTNDRCSLGRHKIRAHGHTPRAYRRRGYAGYEDLPFIPNVEVETENPDNGSPLPVPHIISNQATLDASRFATPSVRNSPGPSSIDTHGPAFNTRPVPYSAKLSDFPAPSHPGPSLPSLRGLALDLPDPSNLGKSDPVPRHSTGFSRHIYSSSQSNELAPLTATTHNVRLAPMLTPMNREDGLSGFGSCFGQEHHQNNQVSLAATTSASNLSFRNRLGLAGLGRGVNVPTTQAGSLRPGYPVSQHGSSVAPTSRLVVLPTTEAVDFNRLPPLNTQAPEGSSQTLPSFSTLMQDLWTPAYNRHSLDPSTSNSHHPCSFYPSTK